MEDSSSFAYQPFLFDCSTYNRVGGMIVIDNTLWFGAVIDENKNDPDTVAIRQLNEKVCEH